MKADDFMIILLVSIIVAVATKYYKDDAQEDRIKALEAALRSKECTEAHRYEK